MMGWATEGHRIRASTWPAGAVSGAHRRQADKSGDRGPAIGAHVWLPLPRGRFADSMPPTRDSVERSVTCAFPESACLRHQLRCSLSPAWGCCFPWSSAETAIAHPHDGGAVDTWSRRAPRLLSVGQAPMVGRPPRGARRGAVDGRGCRASHLGGRCRRAPSVRRAPTPPAPELLTVA